MPRDPSRIRPTLDAIEKLWEKDPDLRLGQLIESLCWEIDKDPFYIEDDQLVEAAEAATEKGGLIYSRLKEKGDTK